MSPLLPKSLRRKRTGRRRGTPALLIAAVVIFIPVALIYYAFTHSLPFLSSHYTDYAIVSNSVNLRPGAPVRIAGIDVGEVSGVHADGDVTKVAFNVDAAARPIHQDATVTIRDRLFLEGSYYLQLDPGSPSAPMASEGYTIKEPNTATPVQFFQLLSTFDSAARASLANLLKTTNVAFSPAAGQPESNSGAGALKRAIPELTPDLKDFALVSQSLSGTHAGDVQTLLTSTADVSGELADHRAQLANLIDQLDVVAGTLAGEDDAIGATINGVDETLQQTPPALVALNRSLTPLDTLAGALTPALKQSPPLVSGLASEIDEVNTIIKPGAREKLIGSLSTLLVTTPRVLSQTANFFPATEPAAACLADKVTPLLNEQVQDGNLSTGEPVWKDLIHAFPNLAAASGSYDANGPYLRGLIGLSNNSVPSSALGSLPGASQLIGTIAGTDGGASSTSTGLTGTSPTWLGDLTASDFRPDVACTTQPLPTNLVSDPAEADQ